MKNTDEHEKLIAEMEAEQLDAEDRYFGARQMSLDTPHNRHIFRAGFERGYYRATEPQEEG